MSKYTLTQVQENGCTFYAIRNNDDGKYFAGYDFMGSCDWVRELTDAYWMDDVDAYQTKADLDAADAPAGPKKDPAKEQYILKTMTDGETFVSVVTGKQIADIYETDQICGIYSDMQVWDFSGNQPVRVDLLNLVTPILDQKHWMEQEYRDYCDNVNEYGLDFEGRDE